MINKFKGYFNIVKRLSLKLANKSFVGIALVFVVLVASLTGVAILSNSDSSTKIGIADALDNYFDGNQEEADISEYLATTVSQAKEVVSFYDSVAIAQVDDSVNVRSGPGTEYEIVGIINNNCAATIISEANGWYYIQSGNVTGYILKEYFITGDAAEVKAREVGYINAIVTTPTLNVRETQSIDSAIVSTLVLGDERDVVEYGDGWVCINITESVKGWVSMEFVTVDVKFQTALTVAEQAAIIAEQERLAAESAAAIRAAQVVVANPAAPYVDTADKAALRAAVVAYALQFNGNPYVPAGRSLITGTDCSGFTMLVYQAFGYGLSPSSDSQRYQGTWVAPSLDSLLPGDILCGYGHVALYIGNGQIIHAATSYRGIVIDGWNSCYWLNAIRVIN